MSTCCEESRAVKDSQGPKTPGIYCVPCMHSKECMRRTSKGHVRHLCLGWPAKSAVAERIMDMEHHIKFNGSHTLDKATSYVDCMVKEATQI